jgi:hypothetical protein
LAIHRLSGLPCQRHSTLFFFDFSKFILPPLCFFVGLVGSPGFEPGFLGLEPSALPGCAITPKEISKRARARAKKKKQPDGWKKNFCSNQRHG